MKTPKIRFKGYTEDWEQRKLGDEATEMFAGGDIDKEKVVDNGKYPIYANALTNDGIVGYYDDYYRVKAPAVTVTGRGDVGHAQARTTDFTPVVRLLAIRSKHDIYFLENAINNHGVIVESTGVPQLTVPQLGNYTISFPKTIDEETKIGEYFYAIDHLITLHQRKCKQIKKLKKFMLQNMFPKNGEYIPTIRFEGFTNDWEQRKLGEVLDVIKDGTHGTHQDAVDGPLLLSAKNIKNGTIIWDETDRKISEDEYEKIHSKFKLQKDDVLLTIVGSIGETAILKDILGITFQRSVAFLRPSKEVTSEFIYSEIQTPRFQKELDNRKSTSAQPGIYLGDLSEIPFTFTRTEEEQERIGDYFSKIDNLITLHQRKCDELQNLKKYMLQNMFI